MSKRKPTEIAAGAVRRWLQGRYDELWSRAVRRIREGEIEIDPVLQAPVPDRRRGMTVIARPSQAVRQSVAAFLRGLRRLEPDQYYYTASEFHVTVLSLFTATAEFEPFFAQRERYLAPVNAALRSTPPIHMTFEGVTASPGTVMIQGFFKSDELNRLRDRLRGQLRRDGLGAGVDQRYRLQTAHMTVVRFRAPLRDPGRFAEALQNGRARTFGRTTVNSFALVENDWYMSRRATRALRHYS